jgi:putative restriction endonuclease
MAFDKPVFKVLAHNDTGGAPGHQGGVLIPKDLESYFPPLSSHWTSANPTVSCIIDAELFDGATSLAKVQTRYQYQTWGAKRRPERRITGNLGELRSRAKRNDILLMERNLSKASSYRLRLIRRGTPAYLKIVAAAPGRRWGHLANSIAI